MILKVCSIYDRKTNTYGQPFYCKSEGEALRMVHEAIVAGDSLLSRYPDDFSLYDLGCFDDQEGTFVASRPVCMLASLKITVGEVKSDVDSQSV